MTPTLVKTDPLNPDTDGDGRIDSEDPFPTTLITKWEICIEGIKNLYGWQRYRGIRRSVERCVQHWYDYAYTVSPLLVYKVVDPRRNPGYRYDYDGDGISMVAETFFNTKPGLERSPGGSGFTPNPKNEALDTDRDGISDLHEILIQTNPNEYIYPTKNLAFVEISVSKSGVGVGADFYIDIDDVMGLSMDGAADWITIWVTASAGVGKSAYGNLDGGFTGIRVENSTEEDVSISPGLNLQLLVIDTSNSFHFNPGLALSYGRQIAKFDIERSKLQELGLSAALTRISPVFAFLKSAAFVNWVKENIDDIARGNYPEGVRNAEINGEGEGMRITAFSPVDLIVKDPDGLTVDKYLSEIQHATYTEADINGDGDLDDQITILDRKLGDYSIEVVPEPGVALTDTYTLEVSAGGEIVVIANKAQIKDIPDQPYVIKSAAEGISLAKPVTPAHSRGIGIGVLVGIILGVIVVGSVVFFVLRSRVWE